MTVTNTRRRPRAQETECETAPKPKRTRRTPEQMIADLEAEIARVKARAAAKKARQADEGKTFMAAVKALDKAMDSAREAGNDAMLRAVEAASAPLSTHLVEMGVRVPTRRRRRAG